MIIRVSRGARVIIRVSRRLAFTLIEIMVMGLIGLLVVGGIVALLTAAWRQDAWTTGRLDAMTAIYSTLEALRVDLFYADAGSSDPAKQAFALRTNRDGKTETSKYSWGGPDKPLMRNDKPLGFARPTNVALKVIADTAVLEMDVPTSAIQGAAAAHTTKVTVPIIIPDAYWREQVPFWAPKVP